MKQNQVRLKKISDTSNCLSYEYFPDSLKINYKNWLSSFVRKALISKFFLFSTKDKVPYGLMSYAIYNFLCADCNASYVGETYRYISTRTHDHLETDKSSNIYRHLLNNPQCKSICDENCFSILDSARTKYTYKLKKGMYIKSLKIRKEIT